MMTSILKAESEMAKLNKRAFSNRNNRLGTSITSSRSIPDKSSNISASKQKSNLSVRAKEQMERINNENKRLYGQIVNIDNSLQFGFLGLNKTKRQPQDRALEAGLILKAHFKNQDKSPLSPEIKNLKIQSMKGMLDKDRTLRDKGGHSLKNINR